jgi:PST family polysaccharide transporter
MAIATTAVVSSVFSLGLDSIVVRELVRRPEDREQLLGTAFLLRLAGSSAAFLAVLGIGLATRPAGSSGRWVTALVAAGLLFQAFDTVDLYFQSRLQSRYTVMVKALAYAAVSGIRVALIFAHAPLVAFAAANLVELSAGALGLAWSYRRHAGRLLAWRFEGALAGQLVSLSWPLMVNSFAIYVQARIDQVLLGRLLGDHQVGLYSAAVRVSEVFNFIPVALATSVFPAIAQGWGRDRGRSMARLTDLYRLMAWITLAIALPISLFAAPVMHLLYGARFAGAEGVLALFIWSRFFTAFGVVRGIYITSEGLFRFSMVSALVGSIANVVLNLLFIPAYGAVGSVAAMMISFTLAQFILDAFYGPARDNFKAMIKGMISFPALLGRLGKGAA